jgi:hypothetical protein
MKISRRQLRRLIENKLKEQNTTPTVIYGDESASLRVPAGSEAIFKIDPVDPNTHGVSVEVIDGDHTKISLKLPGVKPGVTREDGEKTIMQKLNLDTNSDELQSCTIKNSGTKDATVKVYVWSGY